MPIINVTGSGGGTTVHGSLTGRDAENQHPMSAITGLEAVEDTADNAQSDATQALADATAVKTATKEPSGFESPEDVTITYDSTARTITIAQTGGIVIWKNGVRQVLSTPQVTSAHTDAADNYFLTYSGSAFVWATSIWTFDEIQVAYVYYGGLTFGTRECHGLMQWQSHEELHRLLGTYRVSGVGGLPTAGTYALQSAPASTADNTPGFDEATINDEDLSSTIAAWTQGSYTQLYFASSVATVVAAAATPYRVGGTFPLINTGGDSDTETVSNRYLNVYQVLLPASADAESQAYRMLMLQPQAAFRSLAAAQAEDFRSLNLGDFTSFAPEFVAFTRMTYRTGTGGNYNAAAGSCRLEALTYLTGSRASLITISGFTPASHNQLVDLQGGTDDEYYHMTSAEYASLIGGTLVEAAVDLTATGATDFDAIPTGRKYLLEKLVVMTTAADTATVAPSAKLGVSTNDDEFWEAEAMADDVLSVDGVEVWEIAVARVLDAGEVVRFTVTVGATATELEATIFAIGRYLV